MMTSIPPNPYRWDGDQPDHRVSRRALIERVLQDVLHGKSGYLVGCRGMGKTVFMHELEERLREMPDLDVIDFSGPPLDNDIDGMLAQLVNALGDRLRERGGEPLRIEQQLASIEVGKQRKALKEILDAYLTGGHHVERLVLLYDELDRFEPEPGKNFFNQLEEVRKGSRGQLVVFAAGGVGIAAVDSVRGSSFFSRLTDHVLEPFTRDELIELAAPFDDLRGQPLPNEMIDLLRLASGGNGMLATYGLEMLWKEPEPQLAVIEKALAEFRYEHERTIAKIQDPVFGPGNLARAPRKVWETLEKTRGRIERADLERIVAETGGEHSITAKWVLTMLRATGLIRCAKDAHARPVVEVEIIPSILTFHTPLAPSQPEASLRAQLVSDLSDALVQIHGSALDFTRAIDKGTSRRKKSGADAEEGQGNSTKAGSVNKRELHEEAVYSGIISVFLSARGWQTDREPQLAAGQADIKARHSTFGEQEAVIEVKLWPRNDYEDIHQQVQGYWSEGVVALATVMLSDVQKNTLKQDYRTRCLTGKANTVTEKEPRSETILGHFTASTAQEAVTEVDHFLLRLPVRETRSAP